MARDALQRATPPAASNGNGQVVRRERNALELKQDHLAGLIKAMSPAMAAALPKHITAERMARIATTVMRRTPKLAETKPESFLGAVMTCAQLGLEPGPSGHAYLVPYGPECTFVLGYRGMIELARRTGEIETIYAEPVYQLDTFSYVKGLNPDLVHEPYTGVEEPESAQNPLTHVYAVAKYKGGGYNFVVLSRAQVEKYRQKSKAGNFGPWKTDYVAMALKTAIRRLATWMPQSIEFQTAQAVDGQVRTDWQNPDALDDLAVPAVIDSEAVEEEGPPAGMDPVTGEVPASVEGKLL